MSLLEKQTFIYTYSYHPDEKELCQMEMRAFFNEYCDENVLKTNIVINPNRSPFIIGRLEVLLESAYFSDVLKFTKQLHSKKTYKVQCLNNQDFGTTKKISHQKRREIERQLGITIIGEPSLTDPAIVYGILYFNEKWYFGVYVKSEPEWIKHIEKPHQYSTALNTKVARSVVNILVPFPEAKRIIDPCCGIGTVVIEALSMGIHIEGRDIKPLVCKLARENLAYFHLDGTIVKGDIGEITNVYDGAIIDLPYNIFTHTSDEQLFHIFQSARKIAKRVLFITIDEVDNYLTECGFIVVDECIVKKRHFKRQILLCE